mgnify:CR=1 FL=1
MAKLTTKFKSLKKTTKVDFATYLGVIAVFIVVTVLQNGGMLNRKTIGLLVPICCYMSMAVSLNLTVGILGELSLGHAGFMSVGAFSGVIVSQSLLTAVPNAPVRLDGKRQRAERPASLRSSRPLTCSEPGEGDPGLANECPWRPRGIGACGREKRREEETSHLPLRRNLL